MRERDHRPVPNTNFTLYTTTHACYPFPMPQTFSPPYDCTEDAPCPLCADLAKKAKTDAYSKVQRDLEATYTFPASEVNTEPPPSSIAPMKQDPVRISEVYEFVETVSLPLPSPQPEWLIRDLVRVVGWLCEKELEREENKQ